MEAKVVYRDGMAFDVELGGFNFTIDADEQFGGRNLGPKPKGLTLVSLIGCTAMDVIAILQKMRLTVDTFEVSSRGVLAADHPKKFDEITVTYRIKGQDLPEKKVRRAVQLSQNNYCGVRATLAPAVKLHTEIYLNDQPIEPPAEDD